MPTPPSQSQSHQPQQSVSLPSRSASGILTKCTSQEELTEKIEARNIAEEDHKPTEARHRIDMTPSIHQGRPIRPTTQQAQHSSIHTTTKAVSSSTHQLQLQPHQPEQVSTRPISRPKHLSQTPSGTQTQLLRRVVVAGVTVEVVKQGNTIIYRLPGNMPVSSLTSEQRTKVMSEIQRMRSSTVLPGAPDTRKMQNHPLRPGNNNNNIVPNRQLSKSPSRSSAVVNSTQDHSQSSRPHVQQSRSQPPKVQPRPQSQPSQRNQLTAQTPHSSQLQPQPDPQKQSKLLPIRPYPAPRQILPRNPSHTAGSTSAKSRTLGDTPAKPTLSKTAKITKQTTSKSPSLNTVASSAISQKAATERMFQAASLKLISGPLDILKKLNPPADLNAIMKENPPAPGETTKGTAMLLNILKSLSVAQVSQLATMYETDLKSKGLSLRLGPSVTKLTPSALRAKTQETSSQLVTSRMRESSPSIASASSAESDSPSTLIPGAGTSAKKRKNTKLTKQQNKKLMLLSNGGNRHAADLASSLGSKYKPLETKPKKRNIMDHPELQRPVWKPISTRPQLPEETQHKEEVVRRFREALAMDHQMIEHPDWQTPFKDTKDIIGRLLPFHVFQYPDEDIDNGIHISNERSNVLCKKLYSRFDRLADQYNKLLKLEGSESFYSIDNIQLEHQRLIDARVELERLQDTQLQRGASSALPRTSIRGIPDAGKHQQNSL